jgi:hypothetical protein
MKWIYIRFVVGPGLTFSLLALAAACAVAPPRQTSPTSPLLSRAAQPTLFRVEMRRHEFTEESRKSARLRRSGPELQGQNLQSRVLQTAFVVGRLNDELFLSVSPDSFRVRLGSLSAAGVEAAIDQQSRPLEGGRGSSLSTRVMAPLGVWMPVAGFDVRGDARSREILGLGVSAERRDSGYEIRVSAAR